MPTPRINKGAFGGPGLSAAAGEGARKAVAGVEQDFKEGQARNIAREERDYLKSERKRVADERVYQREEDFYMATDIPDAGLGYESGLEDIFRGDKSKFAEIAGKGANASSEDRAKLRQLKENINKVSVGQASLKKVLGDYRTSMDTDGAISASTPPAIAQLLKDLDMGKGEFKPVSGPNGEIRLQGKDSAGNDVDYSYDQLQSLKFSPKYDINASVTDDIKLIGKEIREVANPFGGSATYTNTSGLISDKARGIAESRLKSTHALFEVGAELGYSSEKRDKIIAEQGQDAFRDLITNDYTQRLLDASGSSVTTEGIQSQGAADRAAAVAAGKKSTTLKWKPDEIKNFESTISSVKGILSKSDGFSQEGVQRLKNLFPEELARIKWQPADKDGPARIGYKGKADAPYEYFAIEDLDSAVNAFSRLGGVPQLFINNNSGGGGWRKYQ